MDFISIVLKWIMTLLLNWWFKIDFTEVSLAELAPLTLYLLNNNCQEVFYIHLFNKWVLASTGCAELTTGQPRYHTEKYTCSTVSCWPFCTGQCPHLDRCRLQPLLFRAWQEHTWPPLHPRQPQGWRYTSNSWIKHLSWELATVWKQIDVFIEGNSS